MYYNEMLNILLSDVVWGIASKLGRDKNANVLSHDGQNYHQQLGAW